MIIGVTTTSGSRTLYNSVRDLSRPSLCVWPKSGKVPAAACRSRILCQLILQHAAAARSRHRSGEVVYSIRTGTMGFPVTVSTLESRRFKQSSKRKRRESRQFKPFACSSAVTPEQLSPGADKFLQRVELAALHVMIEGRQLVVGGRDHDAAGLHDTMHPACRCQARRSRSTGGRPSQCSKPADSDAMADRSTMSATSSVARLARGPIV